MFLVTKPGNPAPPPQSAASRPAAAPEQAAASVPAPASGQAADSVPAPASARAPTGGTATQQEKKASSQHEDVLQPRSVDHTAPAASDGGGVGDDQAQGGRKRKRGATDAAACDAGAPPSKKGKGQSHGQQPSSQAAKDAQQRKAPSEQPPVQHKSAFRGVTANRDKWKATGESNLSRLPLLLPPTTKQERTR
jgi:hypothetical protein